MLSWEKKPDTHGRVGDKVENRPFPGMHGFQEYNKNTKHAGADLSLYRGESMALWVGWSLQWPDGLGPLFTELW